MTTVEQRTPPAASRRIAEWRPEDEAFWRKTAASVARRNLVLSVFAEHVGFSVWSSWSVLVLFLGPAYHVDPAGKFLLTAVPTALGAALRLPYTFAVARFGGRNWTMISAALLLVPTAPRAQEKGGDDGSADGSADSAAPAGTTTRLRVVAFGRRLELEAADLDRVRQSALSGTAPVNLLRPRARKLLLDALWERSGAAGRHSDPELAAELRSPAPAAPPAAAPPAAAPPPDDAELCSVPVIST